MRVLVATNILVRSVQRSHPNMRIARLALRSLVAKGVELCVNPQNIAEFWSVCTRPVAANGLGHSIFATDRLTSRIERFFTVLPETLETFRQWRRLIVDNVVKGSKVHDARLVSIMLVHDIAEVLTFNVGDFRRYRQIVAVRPKA
jgi:predicted nucleic acid-binding protein